MTLNELTTVMRARRFVSKVKPAVIPVPMQPYLDEIDAILKHETDFSPDEAGCSFAAPNGKRYICVNAADREERQRFTICHEIAHVVLGLESDHATQPWSGKRPREERLCDSFAAELLMPDELFRPLAEDSAVSLASVDELASQFLTSTMATGSRFAAAISTPCAFVLAENGMIRYTSRSKALVEANAWIVPNTDLPCGAVSQRVRADGAECRGEIDADVWFSNWERGGTLFEEARHLARWDRTLSLLWFESGEVPRRSDDYRHDKRWTVEGTQLAARHEEEEGGLEELDGNLRWPGKGRHR